MTGPQEPTAVGYGPLERAVVAVWPDLAGVGEQSCAVCGHGFGDGDQVVTQVLVSESGSRAVRQHRECMVLEFVSHQHGGCSCSGVRPSRAAALELWARLEAAGVVEPEDGDGG